MTLALKLSQIAGALLLAIGLAAFIMKYGDGRFAAQMMLLGGAIYAVGRIAIWLRAKD